MPRPPDNPDGPLTIAKLRAARKILKDAECEPFFPQTLIFSNWKQAVYFWRHGCGCLYSNEMGAAAKTLRETGEVMVGGICCMISSKPYG